MIEISYLSAIRFNGPDAGEFLHNQVSADIKALTVGESVFACYCEPKGRVLALMLVGRVNGAYIVVMSRSLVMSVSNRLRMYVLRADVSVEVLDKYVISGIKTDNSSALTGESLATIPIPDSDRWFVVTADQQAQDSDSAAVDNWKAEELQMGISWLCPETSGQFLPQMLGFDQLGAVNFRKGCYPGQEIVARTRYLGKVKRHPRLLATMAIVCPNPMDKIEISSEIHSHQAVITDCAHGADGRHYLRVVTRMDPELDAESFAHQGLVAPLTALRKTVGDAPRGD